MKLLLAEDEVGMSRAVTAILTHNGYEVDVVFDGQEALDKAYTYAYDCMIIDIMMPKLDGLTVLKRLRSNGNVTPILMLTAKAEIEDRIEGLDAGADDYLTKPFAMGELLARVRSLTRRANNRYTPTRLTFGNVSLNLDDYELSSHATVRLARKEAKMMQLFLLNPEKLLSGNDFLSYVWADEDDINQDVVWIYISYLRDKLDAIDADVVIDDMKREFFMLRRSRK
ncbi:MAG: response regulator transcription factor [Erysipelotrichaceae bacterium]|nr:response regulator transcription factor [Erysipelotrichaceae bacterium]